MPHYANGTEARVGDQVFGPLYNTLGDRAGTIISITPGQDTCNAMVAFIELVALPDDGDPRDALSRTRRFDRAPRMAVWPTPDAPQFRIVRGERHGNTGAKFALFECVDYCEVRALTKIGGNSP